MKARAVWIEKFRSVLDDSRGHSVVVDLPKNLNGDDTGTSALELAVMALVGCISTIFKLMADKTKIDLKCLEVVADAEKSEETKTVSKVDIKINVVSSDDEKKLERVWKLTHKNCPVGILFEKAGVEVSVELNVSRS